MNSQMENYSLNFNGHDSYVQIDNAPNISHSLTISCWAKSKTSNWDRDAMLLCKRNSYMIATNKGSKILRFYIYSNGWQYAFTNLDIDITQWHHYLGTFDGEFIRFYIDGEAVNSTYFKGEINQDSHPLYIGHDPLRNTYFNGQITEVCIWDQAKKLTEIKTDLNSELTGQETNLIGYYSLNNDNDSHPEDCKFINTNWIKDYPKKFKKSLEISKIEIPKIETYAIQNLDNQLFLDIPAGDPTQANIIWGYTYNGGVGQQWIITAEGIIKSILGEFALDLKEIPDFPWAKEVTINPINGSVSQQWTINNNGVIKNKSNQFALTMVAKNNYQIAMAYPIDESKLKPNEQWQIMPHKMIEDFLIEQG
ncbi:MAG: LamG-like jellyroll fold domain-containing protein [Crocosphaera sp.]